MNQITKQKLVFDGGFATQLVENGHNIDNDPLWSARLLSTNQKAITDVHKSFLEHGADAILSSTYQASVIGFQKHLKCSVSHAENLINDGARLVLEARDEFIRNRKNAEEERIRPLACASLGPYGAHLSDASEYTGSYVDEVSVEELVDFHRQRLAIMCTHPLDLFVFETIPALAEAVAIRRVIREFPNLRYVTSFSCCDEQHVSHGESLNDATAVFNGCDDVIAVGVNCTSPHFITPLVSSLPEEVRVSKGLLAMPNSGEVWEGKEWREGSGVADLSCFVDEWVGAGVRWIGGCCRTTPKDILNIRKRLYGRDQ